MLFEESVKTPHIIRPNISKLVLLTNMTYGYWKRIKRKPL